MSDDFHPGEGWREVFTEDDRIAPAIRYVDGVNEPRWFVREVPVPPLPTEPYTVIRVTWRSESARPALGDLGIRTLFPDGTWTGWAVENLLERITGFEVLAEPRAGAVKRAEESARRLTAKAVLDRVRPHAGKEYARVTEALGAIAREFGVDA